MNTYLTKIGKQILSANPGLSKVCFAKIIYFVHKKLVLENLSQIQDLEFIRMPLGPVPVDFQEFTTSGCLRIEIEPTGLSYNKQSYFLINTKDDVSDKNHPVIKEYSQQLNKLSTSFLVELSHNEPTWCSHQNGDRYFIDVCDLKTPLPTKARDINQTLDNQRLQGHLVSGMIDDIVRESTSLEYPEG